MPGKTLKKRVGDLKKKVRAEVAGRDPSMTWVREESGNVIHGRLIGLHVRDDHPPYYRVLLRSGCMLRLSGRRKTPVNAGVGMVVSVVETDDISCLRYFIDEMALSEAHFDVWIRWMPFRQEVHVKKIEEPRRANGGHVEQAQDRDDRLS